MIRATIGRWYPNLVGDAWWELTLPEIYEHHTYAQYHTAVEQYHLELLLMRISLSI